MVNASLFTTIGRSILNLDVMEQFITNYFGDFDMDKLPTVFTVDDEFINAFKRIPVHPITMGYHQQFKDILLKELADVKGQKILLVSFYPNDNLRFAMSTYISGLNSDTTLFNNTDVAYSINRAKTLFTAAIQKATKNPAHLFDA